MNRQIPNPVITTIARMVAECETHASLNSLFIHSGAPEEPPEGSKVVKAETWLRQCNRDPKINALRILGRVIENYMEAFAEPHQTWEIRRNAERKETVTALLARFNLLYVKGGNVIAGVLGSPSHSLEEHIRAKDTGSINEEFERALSNVESSPREAVSAACNIVEAVCKIYIEDESLERPAKQDLQRVWSAVKSHLGFDPTKVEDDDLKKILSGLFSIVDGIGAFRTHVSSAHGTGRKRYKLEPRHARLAVHSAHTLVLFILESWDKKRSTGSVK